MPLRPSSRRPKNGWSGKGFWIYSAFQGGTICINGHDFKRVREAAEKACEEAVKAEVGSANFANLYCVCITWCLQDDGDSFWLVDVAEAAPENPELREFIRKKLHDQGIPARIETEW